MDVFKRCGHPRDGSRYCRPCRSEYDRTYRERTADYQRERHARYQKENREIVNAKCRRHTAKHRERRAAQRKAWRAANPEYMKHYRKRNPAPFKVAYHRRRARLKRAEGTHSAEDWRRIVEYQSGKCAICGEVKPLTVDHIIPLSKGGTNWPSNIQGLCLSCNCSKGNRL